MIYFLQGEITQLTKIGYTTRGVEQRITRHQGSSPDLLNFLGACPGDRAFEKELHHRYENARMHYEWFEYTPAIQRFIKERCVTTIQEAKWMSTLLEDTDFDLPFLMEVDPRDLAIEGRRIQHRMMAGVQFSEGQPVATGPLDIRLTTQRRGGRIRVRTSTVADPGSPYFHQVGAARLRSSE